MTALLFVILACSYAFGFAFMTVLWWPISENKRDWAICAFLWPLVVAAMIVGAP